MSESQASGDFQVDRVRSADIGLWFDRSTAEGLVINDLGSGAISRLGFREGDRIYSVNGVRVDSEATFVRTLFDPRWRDQRVNVIIYRHGRPWTVYVQPSVLVQEYTTVTNDPLDDWGLVLDDRYDDYVVIWRVRPRSPAFYAGLRAGDVIVNWQGRRLSGPDEFVRLAGQGSFNDVALDINRNRQTRRIDLDLSGVGARTSARTSLRPDFDAAGGATIRGPARVNAGADVDADVDLRPGIRGGARTGAELEGNLRTGSRFDSTIDGRLEGHPDGRLDRTDNRSLFPSNAPSGVPTPGTGVRGTVEVPGVTGGVRVQGSTRDGIFGGRRP
jgi:C-terminal processing protease CtpA/Prc